jgi:S-adenosylmethionine synthetase
MADQISDSILDAFLTDDPKSRVAVETLLTTGQIHVAGEVTTLANPDLMSLVRSVVLDIGYNASERGFDGNSCGISLSLGKQSPDIAQGVDAAIEERGKESSDPLDKQGAGDQGLMFGYASDDTPELMPLPIAIAHALSHELAKVRKSGALTYLRPDAKTQVTVEYDGNRATRLDTLIISTQHDPEVDLANTLPQDLRRTVIEPVLSRYALSTKDMLVLVNPTGRFVLGGPMSDAGLTGRKIIVDSYGGMARHGGGAFSGKDPSKVDRSAAYALRWVAKNIVAAGLAKRCEVQVAYAIGKAQPVGLFVETFGTESVDVIAIQSAVTEVFDLRPAAIIRDLDLLRPIYRKTSNYGHFGRERPEFTWERRDRVEALQRAIR